jgi:hypothetical protein
MTVTDLGIAGRRGTGDAPLDDLLQGTDAVLGSALRAQRGRLDNKDLIATRLWTLLIDRIVKGWRMGRPLAERIMDQALGYLRLCATHPDQTFSPSPLVDIGWHIFILHTRAYTESNCSARDPRWSADRSTSCRLDNLLEEADAALRVGIGAPSAPPVHRIEPCADPDCTIEREHGHNCPRCGPGTYDIAVDVDD